MTWLGLALLWWAGEQRWEPASTTAMAITGSVTISDNRMTAAGQRFTLWLARKLKAGDLANAGKIVDLTEQPESGQLFRTKIGRQVKLLHGNSICGEQDARWMLMVSDREGLSLAFFSGEKEPVLDAAAVAAGRELCDTFRYARAR